LIAGWIPEPKENPYDGASSRPNSLVASKMRQNLKYYFFNEGAIDFQWTQI